MTSMGKGGAFSPGKAVAPSSGNQWNPAIAADAFAVPDAVKAAAKPPATGNVPYQWVLRRLFLTRFTDSDNIIFPNGGGLKLRQLFSVETIEVVAPRKD